MNELKGKINEVDEQSEFVTEVLAKEPQWILRFSLFILLGIITFIFIFLFFIKYPDILNANITLTTLNPPVKLVAKSTGKLKHLLVKNNQPIKAGQIVAIIESDAEYSDVLLLENTMENFMTSLRKSDSPIYPYFKENLLLGEITPYHLTLLKSVKDLVLHEEINSYKRQSELLKKDLLNYQDLLLKYKKQEGLSKEQFSLIENDFSRDKTLLDSKSISAREFENKKKEYLSALTNNEQIKIKLSETLIKINSTEQNMLQLEILDYQEKNNLRNDVEQNLKSLLTEINKWKKLYLIESPIRGRISFFNIWATNQNINPGDELFTVIPDQKPQYIGKCTLPTLNTGKLKLGQKVNIKLDNYPFIENGMLEGKVSCISKVPNKGNYAVDIELTRGLVTTYNQILGFREEMTGSAEIITENMSLMNRIFFNFRKLNIFKIP